ncbi:hypothetical protein GCM10008106_32310 [Mongoliitalea lutea]|uniref:Uncharacterized protein n=1 Tax=Mongoliitalea lutea TaxID=849756 RepID=A0A8J3CZJ0_9BACT|nr:hypothetical protein GCM10008106_32310 [Mongoliitalea lutea]
MYEYKISNARYNALKVLLEHNWEETVECYASFVLYSVDFLRSEISEGHLRWDYIFNSVGKGNFNTPQRRALIVEQGLNYWKRNVFQGQNMEFLETLRFESGLPNSSLHDGNNLSSLIKYAFQLVESYKLTEEELIPFIEERIEKYSIPQVLRQEYFYQLVSKLCFKFLEFKQRFDLSNQSNPTEYLQSQLTNWRAEMPLKVEGERMNEFFNNIISDISKLKKTESLAFVFDTLLKDDISGFTLNTFLSLPKGIYSHEAFGLSEEEFNKLPGYFCLTLEIDGKPKPLTGFNKQNNGRISARGADKILLPQDIFEREWELTFTSENMEVRVETELAKYSKISFNEPLIFVKDILENWVYKGSAPLKIKETVCRIVFDESIYKSKSSIQNLGKTSKLLSVFQTVVDLELIEKESQSSLWIKLAQENEHIKVLDFAQKFLPESGSFDYLVGNKHIFLGIPKIYLLNRKLGIKEFFTGIIEVFSINNQWSSVNNDVIGSRKFRFKDKNGNVIGVKTLNILPSDFRIILNDNAKSIELLTQCNFQVFVTKNGILTDLNSSGNSVKITIDPAFDDASKTFINFGISFEKGEIIDIKVPNPSFTEIFVNAEGKVVERSSFSLSRIHGLSITNNNFNGVATKKIYKLKLYDIHDQDASALEIRKEVWVDAFSSKRLPLYQWTQQINQLFALTSNTRAKVRISSEKPHHFLEISKYDFDLGYDGITGQLFINDYDLPQELTLWAFRLDQIFNPQNIVTLELLQGQCNVSESLPEDGIWFIYSNKESDISVVPKVILKDQKEVLMDERPIEYLYEASYLDYNQRIDRFKEFFDNHYLSFDHPVWKELYELYQATEGLPISALDVWKGLVKSPKGMLTFLFSQYVDASLIQKVSNELGFIWHLVSVYRWKEAFESWKTSILNSNNYSQIYEIFKSSKLSLIQNQLGLHSLVELLNEDSQSINLTLLSYLLNIDVNGGEGRQGIRARHPDGVYWASYAREFILDKFKQLPKDLKDVFPSGLANWQKPVLYLPVILAYQSMNSRFIKVYELSPEILLGIKLNIDFDRDYFDDVYSKVQGFCFTHNKEKTT